MKRNYSAFALLREGLGGHKGWPRAWRKAKPKPAYDFVVVGGGGHGLATAYYLARNHGRSRVCVIEKGWLGGGNTGRNTTVVRSNYFYPELVALYDLALRLYEGLSRELNFNVMLSQRGILNVSHTPAQLEIAARVANAMQLNGVDAELWGPDEIRKRLPLMTQSLDSRYLPNGGVWQRRGGTARHDAVAWGYARAADRLGVDIVENCEATGFMMENGACVGVETALGEIRAEAVGVAVAGHSSQLLAKAGVKLPIHSYALQAMVSEPVKPCLDIVVLHLGTGVYASQSDKGETGIRRRARPRSLLRPARQSARAGDCGLGPSRHVPRFRPTENDAAMGRHRRRRAGLLTHHRPRADCRRFPELRMGHRRLQGDSGRRHVARASHGDRRPPRHQPSFRYRPFCRRAPHRRGPPAPASPTRVPPQLT